jgi:hypothetical protein
VEILIDVSRLDPPSGHVRFEWRETPFRGWLELLQVLAELLPVPRSAAGGVSSGQRDA